MIIEHGHWSISTPSGTTYVLHAQRDDTGMDWYEFVKLRPFGDESVVMTVGPVDMAKPEELIIQAATRDPTAIFPAGMTVIEETDYAGSNPFGDFHGRIYAGGIIGDMYVPPPPPPTAFETAVLGRLTALEAKIGL